MVCATLYTISQVLKSRKFSNKILTRSTATLKKQETEIDLSETMDDITIDKETTKKKKKEKKNTIILSNVVSEPKEIDNKIDDNEVKPDVEIKREFKATTYDPFDRNPLRSGANLSFYNELSALARHFHPSVSLFATTIISGNYYYYFLFIRICN